MIFVSSSMKRRNLIQSSLRPMLRCGVHPVVRSVALAISRVGSHHTLCADCILCNLLALNTQKHSYFPFRHPVASPRPRYQRLFAETPSKREYARIWVVISGVHTANCKLFMRYSALTDQESCRSRSVLCRCSEVNPPIRAAYENPIHHRRKTAGAGG
jgi:hypothetical protein